jgi:hypothetical protein
MNDTCDDGENVYVGFSKREEEEEDPLLPPSFFSFESSTFSRRFSPKYASTIVKAVSLEGAREME